MNGKQAPTSDLRSSLESLVAAMEPKPLRCQNERVPEHELKSYTMLHEKEHRLIVDSDRNYISILNLKCGYCGGGNHHRLSDKSMEDLARKLLHVENETRGLASVFETVSRAMLAADGSVDAAEVLPRPGKADQASTQDSDGMWCLACGREFAPYRLIDAHTDGGRLFDQDGSEIQDIVLSCGKCQNIHAWHGSTRVRAAKLSGALNSRLTDIERAERRIAHWLHKSHPELGAEVRLEPLELSMHKEKHT